MSRQAFASALFVGLVACSGGAAQGGLGDGGTSPSSSNGDDPGASSSPSPSPSADGTCTLHTPPEGATAPYEFEFTGFDATGEGSDGWRSIGFDLDEQCSTPTSPPICRRLPGSTSASMSDGDDGIDNMFGKSVMPILRRHAGTVRFTKGKIVGGPGNAVITLDVAGVTLDLSLEAARFARDGSSAVVAGLILTDALTSGLMKVAGRLSKSLCSRTELDAVVAEIRQTSDSGDGGGANPTRDCDHISIGVKLTGLFVPTTVPPPTSPGPDPCTN